MQNEKNCSIETLSFIDELSAVQPIEDVELTAAPASADAGVENITPVEESTEPKTKASRKSTTRDDVLSRRRFVYAAYEDVVSEMKGPMTRVQMARAADEKLGRPGDSTSWVDGGCAIASFVRDGILVKTQKEGKKKTLYSLAPEAKPEQEAAAE